MLMPFFVCRVRPRQEQPGVDHRQVPPRSSREDGRPYQQPRGQEPSRHKEPNWLGGPAAPPQPRERERERGREPREDQVVRREGANDKRPKSSYTGRDTSPQSPREKRPLSGPNIRTPNLPVTDGVIKTAQQTTRPFNTYPRSESDSGRSPTGQVHKEKPEIKLNLKLFSVNYKQLFIFCFLFYLSVLCF